MLEERYGKEAKFIVPSNGFFDTTRANCSVAGIQPQDLFHHDLKAGESIENLGKVNNFRGDMPIDDLKSFIKSTKVENIPFIMMTVTNNTAAGQPVSLKNLQEVR